MSSPGSLIRLPARQRKVNPLGPALANGDGRTVSLISSLIHVRVPTSTTVYCSALSRVNRPHGRSRTGILKAEGR